MAAACCLGGSSKSFLSLQRLQKYEFGTALSYKEDYGHFGSAGLIEPGEIHRTFQMMMGGATRLHPDWQIHAFAPLVSQFKSYGARQDSSLGLGDVMLGVEWTALEALFTSDWYPTVRVQTGLKLPTGSVEKKIGGTWTPGTGNGMWEPYASLAFEKKLGQFTLGLRGGFTGRFSSGDKLGPQLDLSETVAYNFTPRFSLAVGSTQWWNGNSNVSGKTIADSGGSAITAFVQPTYFLDRTWSVSLAADFSVPQNGWSRNTPATQSVSLITRYGLF